MTRNPLGLPPITLDLVIGTAGDRNEPVTAEHLNAGINFKDAAALKVRPPERVYDATPQYQTAMVLSMLTAVLGIGGNFIMSRAAHNLPLQIAALVMCILAALSLIAALTVGLRAMVKKRRDAAALNDFSQAVLKVLRFQDKLVALPFIGHYDHNPVVTEMIKDLQLSRYRLTVHAGDGRIQGEKELLTALEALGDYARTEHATNEQYVTARDAVRAFTTLQESTTGELTSTASKRAAQ